MNDSEKARQQALDLLLIKGDLVLREVHHIAMRMKELERWRITMDTILRTTSENN